MTVSFVCPNGHQLTAPENLAGKPGKCPHCGSRFLIPTLEEIANAAAGDTHLSSTAAPPAATSGSGKSVSPGPAASKSDAAPGGAKGGAKEDTADSIVFTCPNGHKLNGPSALRGKLGQCPHCGSRFRIPADAALGSSSDIGRTKPPPPTRDAAASVTDEFEEEIPEGEPVGDSGLELEPFAGMPLAGARRGVAEAPSDTVDDGSLVAAIGPWRQPPPSPGTGHRLAQLFTWIWTQRDPNSVVELALKDGRKFVPTWFSPELSQDDYGVFAGQDESDRYTLTVIGWAQVERVDVRDLDVIPQSLFT